jgi:alpha-beta hydrolase superfamily lysophospholipase
MTKNTQQREGRKKKKMNNHRVKGKTGSTVLVVLLILAFIIAVFPAINTTQAATDNWTLVNDARAVKAYPALKEYVWQKTPNMLPNAQYDKIGLHRLVNTATSTKGVVLMLPGTYLSGEGWTSNPPTDNFTKTENDSQAMYWANRGFDVYALDYRTHFAPINLNSTQLGFMANWGYDQWISDIKEAVNKVKEVSGVNKIFIAGFSFGGRVVMYYSAKYWQQDIKGIILLDGGTNIKTANPTNTYNLTALLKQENDTSKWTLEAPNLPGTAAPSGWLFQKQYAAQNPSAPAEYPPGTPLQPTTNPMNGKPWANITEYSAFMMNGTSSNISGGYTNVTILSQAYAVMDRYWPDRLNLEANAINDWTNCPYVTNDFNEYYAGIDLPIISFTSELFGLSRGNGAVANSTNLDTKQTVLRGYGHMDVYCGVYSVRDVSEPVYQWMVNHSTSGWSTVTDARAMKAYPDLKETIWQKTAAMPPNGQYDKIGLHRLVNPNIISKGVIFIANCPTWGTGEERISNPATDNWTKYENFSQAIYLANRGYDVYAIDYRTHFIPKNLPANQTGFMANWGWDVWISDIKEATDKAKEVSGASKFFISGECSGGEAALNYATKYASDLRGIILLDPNWLGVSPPYPVVGTPATTNTYNLTTTLASMDTAKNWTRDDWPQWFKDWSNYALQTPNAPALGPNGTAPNPATNPLTNKTWTNITEFFAFSVTYNFGALLPQGMYSNVLGGYGNVTQDEYCFLNSEYIPLRLYYEAAAMANWVNCPYMTYDYNDHYKEINVPVIAFESSLFANRAGPFQFVNGMATSDFTGVMLPNYGHMDVFIGTNSAKDVSQPALNWMMSHYQPPAASTFSSATVMTGQTWYLFAHSAGSVRPNTYQWYEGTTQLTGQTSMLLPITKTTAGTYTYTCKVTDSEGTTATSNTITLTVLNK